MFKTKRAFLFLLLVVNGVVYAPALKHIPRSDQISFLAETAQTDRLGDLVRHTYSYTRTRHFAQGDRVLFKPLYFFILSLEKWLFGYKFFYWQLTNVVLHLLVVWQLYRLLMRIHPSGFARIVALWFSVLHVSQEMVIYDHLAPYLVWLLLLLQSLRCLHIFIAGHQKDDKIFFKMTLCLFLACFIHEYTLIFIALVISVLWIDRRVFLKRPGGRYPGIFWLLIPVLVYGAWSIGDYLFRVGPVLFSVLERGYRSGPFIFSTMIKVFSLSLTAPFMPAFLDMEVKAMRLFVTFFTRGESTYWDQKILSIGNEVMVGILLTGGVFWLVKGLTRLNKKRMVVEGWKGIRDIKDRWFVGGLCLAASVTFILLIVVGRLNERGVDYLQYNLYYFYCIIVFNSIFFYSIYFLRGAKEHKKRRKRFVVILFLASACLNAYYTLGTNVRMAQGFQRERRILAKVSPKAYYLAKRYWLLGRQKAQQGLYDTAMNYLNQAAELDPMSSQIPMAKGIVMLQQKKYAQALSFFDRSLRLEGDNATVYYHFGIVYEEIGRLDLALQSYTKALALSGRFYAAYLNRGNIYCLYKKYTLALADYSRAIAVKPTIPKAYYNRAITFQEMGRLQEALRDAKRADALGFKEAGSYVRELERKLEASLGR